ncbi:hypothetical protein LSTR_LSTR003539 [Laodelphax striatellus]|uniref:Uncharacterized protein n=1 Tax=Laodelphax striatellus TaxID=195883 RepID=A0A482WKU3_LAOST|nr:hypothetical protein LSTR_LSTR003539 [Laodelphax striatellus]
MVLTSGEDDNVKLVLKNVVGEMVTMVVQSDETFQELQERVLLETGITLDIHDFTIQGKNISNEDIVTDYFANAQNDSVEEKPIITEDTKCAVPGCSNTKLNCPDKAFFQFPLEEVRCHQWALYCQKLSEQSGKHRIQLNMSSAICADHFRRDQFVKNTTTLLKRTAVPCIRPELPPGCDANTPRRKSLALSLSPSISLKSDKIFEDLFSNNLSTLAPGSSVLCRLCANPSPDMLFIFDDIGYKLSILEKINNCLPVVVRNTDPLPKQICRLCYEKLTSFNDMIESSLKAESKLKSLVKDNHFQLDETQNSDAEKTGEGEEAANNTEENIEEERNFSISSEKNEKNKHYCCPLCSCGKMVLKSGIYRARTPACTKQEATDGEAEAEEGGEPRSEVEEENEEASSEQKAFWNGQALPELEMESLYPDCIVGMDLDAIPEESWESETSFKQEQTVSNNKNDIYCRLCKMEFTNINAVLEHSHTHADDDSFPCGFCDSYFPTRSELEQHFQEHRIMKKKIVSSDVYERGQMFACDLCGAPFKTEAKYRAHYCNPAGANSNNRCFQCNKSFRSADRLKFHKRFHEGAVPGYCEICQKTFPDEVKLYKHTMYLHSQNKGHCCEECGKVFRSVSSLRYHQRSHQGETVMKPFTCEQCGKCFIRKSMLRNHMLATHKNLSQEGTCFTCKICFEAFPSTDHAVAHMDIHHSAECHGESTYSFEMHTVTRLYICEYCERCFTNAATLNAHRERHPVDTPYQCKMCDSSFAAHDKLIEHKPMHFDYVDKAAQDYSQDFNIPTVYMCEFCERCFLNFTKLSEHLTVHYGDKPYQCRFCDEKFRTSEEAGEHRMKHDQSAAPVDDFDYYRPYECHYCRKSFAIEDALIKHIRMHTGEKPFICDVCGKGFSQSSGLYTHQKVHSDERPYSCTHCPRTFKIKGDRDVHVRKHSGDRPYTCDFCGKAFMTQHVYSQHRKIHTGERPYRCDVCGITFRRSHVLTVHKRIHTGEKPNVCDICGKRYRQKGDMLKHRRVQHGVANVKVSSVVSFSTVVDNN